MPPPWSLRVLSWREWGGVFLRWAGVGVQPRTPRWSCAGLAAWPNGGARTDAHDHLSQFGGRTGARRAEHVRVVCAWSTGSALARHLSAAGGETPAARLRLTTEILHHVPQKTGPFCTNVVQTKRRFAHSHI